MRKLFFVAIFFLLALGIAVPSAFASTTYSYAQTSPQMNYMSSSRRQTLAYARVSAHRPRQRVYQPVVRSRSNVATIPNQLESWQIEHQQPSAASNNNTGKILVSWGLRGGTCNIRYSETKEAYYKYRTSAGCDEGSHWVGSLQVGESYKFQIAQDNWSNWSGKAVAKAW